MQQYFEYSTEVQQAIKTKKSILALESTVITHGLPFPHNIETAKMLEEIAREQQVVPAIIALMKGKIKIGLSTTELEELANDKNRIKVSRRDIPFALSKKYNAGTTVAATLFCAHLAGIKVFATGGIGGVHRGHDQDISADLIELAKTPLAVVCAGAKSILDLPKTLEFLETFSVPVIGFRTHLFPAFYTAKTSHQLSASVDDIESLVNLLRIHWQFQMPSSILIANPIPIQNEISAEIIEPAISEALKKAEQKQILGKEMTPFLLQEIAEITKGKSLESNISLIKNNVQIGAQLAHALNVRI